MEIEIKDYSVLPAPNNKDIQEIFKKKGIIISNNKQSKFPKSLKITRKKRSKEFSSNNQDLTYTLYIRGNKFAYIHVYPMNEHDSSPIFEII